jgi:formylglycine-generating enzyme required for sulfatase activity
MKVFLSYPSEDRPLAEQIALALAHQGHDVFFDREDLPPGDEFHVRIRRGIERSDLFVFLVSPHAFDPGSYTINELEIARQTWSQPAGRVLPVLLRPTELEQIPNYLKSVTLLDTSGNVVAAIVHAVDRIARARRQKRLARLSLAGAAVGIVGLAVTVYLPSLDPADEVIASDGAPAVRIPAGAFVMGDDENAPRREVYTDLFYLDKFEVTVARYAQFLKSAAAVQPPEGWDARDPARAGELPVVGVSWHDAQAYCRWAGKRLPTEAEWEKAARGADERVFPWGNQTPQADKANFENTSPLAYDGGLAPVGTHAAGASPFGIHDMAGNVSEWVADWYAERLPRGETRNPQGPSSGELKVIRGGGRFDPGFRLAATKRWYADPNHRAEDIGFRCAR